MSDVGFEQWPHVLIEILNILVFLLLLQVVKPFLPQVEETGEMFFYFIWLNL